MTVQDSIALILATQKQADANRPRRQLPVADLTGYDPDTSPESPKVNGGCGCSPPKLKQ